jgi:hypothetical protein
MIKEVKMKLTKYLTESKTFSLDFYECENHGDIDKYKNDIRNSGGKITNTKLNTSDETCKIEFQVSNYNMFMKKFKETDSYQFLN